MESLRIVRDSKPMGEAQGPLLAFATSAVRQPSAPHSGTTSAVIRRQAKHRTASAVAHACKLSLAQCLRSLLLVTRHTWALTRRIVRGRVVWRHDLAGRSSLGRRALGSSAPRSPPYSSHAAGSPDSAAPAVSRTHPAAAPCLRASAVDPGPSSTSCCHRRRRRRQLPPLSLVILTA